MRRIAQVSVIFVFSLLVCLTDRSFSQSQPVKKSDYSGQACQVGIASWYGGGERLNKYTASGEVFDPEKFTAASYAYPLGTTVVVTNLNNGKSITVKINDRGPNKRLHRLIDLSRAAFAKIACLKSGLIKVKVEVLK